MYDCSTIRCIAVAITTGTLFSGADAGEIVFQLLPSPPGYSGSNVFGVSPDGRVALGHSALHLDHHPTRWMANGAPELLGHVPGGFTGHAAAASYDGSVIVGQDSTSRGAEAFRWTAETGMVSIGELPGGAYSGSATCVSADGNVIAGTSHSDRSQLVEAFRWTAEDGMIGLGSTNPDHIFSLGGGISADGRIIVGETDRSEGFRWTEEGGMVGIGFAKGFPYGSSAADISADGTTLIGTLDPFQKAYRWTEQSGFELLGALMPNGPSTATGVSADGSVIVGLAGFEGENVPFIWDEFNGMRSLEQILIDSGINLEGINLQFAADISDDGLTIVGDAAGPGVPGGVSGWIVRIPEPSSLVMLLIGGMLLTRRVRK